MVNLCELLSAITLTPTSAPLETGLNGAGVVAYKDQIYVVNRPQNTDGIH